MNFLKVEAINLNEEFDGITNVTCRPLAVLALFPFQSAA
jgi:hypothetical protein